MNSKSATRGRRGASLAAGAAKRIGRTSYRAGKARGKIGSRRLVATSIAAFVVGLLGGVAGGYALRGNGAEPT